MAAITDIDQIAGEVAKIAWLHRATQPNPMNILLLGDGFASQDCGLFKEFIETLCARFFRIPPFTYCKQYVNILYWPAIDAEQATLLAESKTSGIRPPLPLESEPPPDDWSTIFGSYITFEPTSIHGTNGIVVDEHRFSIPAGGLNGLRFGDIEQTVHSLAGIYRLRLRVWGPHGTRGAFVIHRVVSDTDLEIEQVQASDTWIPGERDLSFDLILLRHLDSADSQRVIDIVKRLELPADLRLPDHIPRETEAIWFSPIENPRSHGAVCLIGNSMGGVAQNLSQLKRWRYFLIDMSGFKPRPGKLYGGFEHVFAHELAHTFRIGDEYEVESGHLGDEDVSFVNASYENVSAYRVTEEWGELTLNPTEDFVNALNWKPLLTAAERHAILNGTSVYSKYRLVDLGLIQREKREDPVKRIFDTVPGDSSRRPTWRDMFLVEGGHHKARNVFRSNLECKMRHSVFGENCVLEPEMYMVRVEDQNEYGAPEFCRVCNFQIRRHVTGWQEFGLGGQHRLALLRFFFEDVMPRVRKAFKDEGKGKTTDSAFCHIASTLAFIVFRQMGLGVKFSITPGHVCLEYHGVYLDPTFYDFYRVRGETGRLKFVTADGYTKPFEGESEPVGSITQEGFAGDLGEIATFFRWRIPRPDSIGAKGLKLPEGTRQLVDLLYENRCEKWGGPEANGPPYTDPYKQGISMEWDFWQSYLTTGSPTWMKSLDVRVSSRKW